MPKQVETSSASIRWTRRTAILVCLGVVTVGVASSGGCSMLRGKSDEEDDGAALAELMKIPKAPELVREAAISQGMNYIRVDGVGAVTSLAGTGGPADPSLFRDQLIEDMKRRNVDDPNHFLESNDTALVRVRAIIPPGARRGDPLDIRVIAPSESRASDLNGGWLLESRLRTEIAVAKQLMQSSIRQSEVLVTATGPVMTKASYTPSLDDSPKIEGTVISGGRVQVPRNLALLLRPKYRHVAIATAISTAVNKRFFFFDGTTRRGIATPREDDFIDVEVHPRYRDNVARMMEVVRAVGIQPEGSHTQRRLSELAARLAVPASGADAAIQLEAIGEGSVPTLIEGTKSSNPEIRFYAAEALAYLDRVESIDVLAAAAKDEPAFRAPALLALQGVKSQQAIDAMKGLMDEPSLETRYGAFCSIRRRPDGKRALSGQPIGAFWLYRVRSKAAAAVVVSLRESPEVVLLGDLQPIVIPEFLRGPGGIMIKPDSQPGKIRISRFQVGKDDQFAVVDADVASLIVGLATVGGGYGDVVEVLRIAKDQGYLRDQLGINPLPESMRTYYRELEEDEVE